MLKRYWNFGAYGTNWRSCRMSTLVQHTECFYQKWPLAQFSFVLLGDAYRPIMGHLFAIASKIHHPVWLAYGSLSNRFYGAMLGDQVFMGGCNG